MADDPTVRGTTTLVCAPTVRARCASTSCHAAGFIDRLINLLASWRAVACRRSTGSSGVIEDVVSCEHFYFT